MSLNGLEDQTVVEAYDAAIAEPGGWFLLKYTSRDEVAVLGKGNGGIVEIRNAIAQHEETSPLLGFLRYRRRSVLIKYVPEDCTRLIQARVSVHFTAFTERFTPHDTVFSIASSKELRDTALTAACSLHTASGSTSSSTSSLRQRRLMEIAEEAEEEQRVERQSMQEERPTTGKESIKHAQALDNDAISTTTNTRPINNETDATTTSLPNSDNNAPTRRLSSQSVRPDMYTLSSYGISNKPKIKLGPRPSLDHRSQSDVPHRPVSSLPAGLKLFRRGSKKQKTRPQSIHQSPGPTLPTTDETSSELEMRDPIGPPASSGRPSTSSGISMKMNQTGVSRTATTMTPEKARLMKALQLRKKQMGSSSPESLAQTPETVMESSEPQAATPDDKEPEAGSRINEASNAVENDAGMDISMAYTANDLCSQLTKTDSSPTSPVGTEHATSTKASSLSESTDEILQESSFQKEHLSSEEAPHEGENVSECVDTDIHSLSDVAEAQEDEIETAHPDLDTGDQQNKPRIALSSSEIPETEKPLISTSSDENPAKEEQTSSASAVDSALARDVATPNIVSAPEQSRQSEVEPPNNDDSSTPTPSTPRELKIPRSKFSMPDLKADGSNADQDDSQVNTAENPPPIPTGLDERNLLGDKDIVQQHERKTSHIDRIRTDMSAANSDNEFLEDDDLMDELQSATFQEAKPMSVAKSPISQIFPVSPSKRFNQGNRISRVASNPSLGEDFRDKGLSPPETVKTGRAVSAGEAYLSRINQQQSATAAKKVNLGSGISQRIKALEKLSSSAPPTGTSSGTTSPAFFSVRQASVRGRSAQSIADRANSLTKNSPSLSRTPSFSPEPTDEAARLRDRAGSIKARKEVFNTAPSFRAPTPTSSRPTTSSRPESISVTARIIRDPKHTYPQLSEAGKDPSEYGPLDLKSSPLTIDHQKAITATKPSTILERRSSKDLKAERRSSMTVVRDLFTPRRSSSSTGRQSPTIEHPEPTLRPETSASTNSRRLSVSSHRSDRNGLSPTRSATLSPTSSRESPGKPPLSASHPKSEGKGMKILKRMSSGFSRGTKTLASAVSPTLREEKEPIVQSQTSQVSTISTVIGDVNVQFPDTLLWKRRHLLLDAQGFLVLSALAQSGASLALAGTKRYHMSDLKMPYVPDIDAQELPNSVTLEFIQGGELQFACQDRAAQGHVLHLLEDAHKVWGN